jgi:hypothetical protein
MVCEQLSSYVPGSGACALETGSRQRSAPNWASRFYSSVERKNSKNLQENMSLGVEDRFSITDKNNLYSCFQGGVKSLCLRVNINEYFLSAVHKCVMHKIYIPVF